MMTAAASSMIRRRQFLRGLELVERSWRSSMATRSHQQTNGEKIPWLLLSSSSPTNPVVSRGLYKLTRDQDFQVIKIHRHDGLNLLPEVAAAAGVSWHIGSSRGFLFYIPGDPFPNNTRPLHGIENLPTSDQVVAVNPLTGAHFRLPPPSPDIFPWQMQAVLSPSLDTAVLLHRCCSPNTHAEFVCFRPLSSSSSSSWTPLRLPRFTATRLDDCIFHKGCLHIVDCMGSIVIFDKHFFDNPLSAPPPPLLLHWAHFLPDHPNDALKNHLVESPDGEDLFMLHRRTCFSYGTLDFKVFKLDKDRGGWQQVESLDDMALFVGSHGVMSFPASHDSCCVLRPHSIYFTDDDRFPYRDSHRHGHGHGLADTGIYCLTDKTVTLLRFADGDTILGYPLPVWLDPTAC